MLIIINFSCDESGTTKPEIKTLNPITEIDLSNILSEPSGIVYNSTNNSFYIVSDTISKIFEINLNGNLIKEILVNANDLELSLIHISEPTRPY